MRKYLFCLLLLAVSLPMGLFAQDWASYFHEMPAKEYQGHRFRLQGMIRAEIQDDSAWAGIWARVDREKGLGFFDNMQNRPVRSRDWKTYTIEGKIDSSANRIVFGALTMFNGKFYFDNIQLSIETGKNKWKTVYTTGFEKGIDDWNAGIGINQAGVNGGFKATINEEGLQGNKVLLLEGKDVPNYGMSKAAGKFADVNGIKLYYEIYGEGQPLVILHGNGGSIASAGPHYPFFQKKYKVIAIDSRGQGRSGDNGEDLNYDQMASDVNELLVQLNIDSVYIWGQSDGAILGLILAMDYPKKVKKVLAFGSNIQPDSSALFSWAVDYVHQKMNSADRTERKLNKLMADQPNIPFSKLASIQIPVLIMSGDRDAIRPEHSLKVFQSIKNSQLCIIPGATHGASWEKMELFHTIATEFFDKPFRMPDTKDWFQ